MKRVFLICGYCVTGAPHVPRHNDNQFKSKLPPHKIHPHVVHQAHAHVNLHQKSSAGNNFSKSDGVELQNRLDSENPNRLQVQNRLGHRLENGNAVALDANVQFDYELGPCLVNLKFSMFGCWQADSASRPTDVAENRDSITHGVNELRIQESKMSMEHLTTVYGNYCGPADGENFTLEPIDALDAVCQQHDFCITNFLAAKGIQSISLWQVVQRPHKVPEMACSVTICDMEMVLSLRSGRPAFTSVLQGLRRKIAVQSFDQHNIEVFFRLV